MNDSITCPYCGGNKAEIRDGYIPEISIAICLDCDNQYEIDNDDLHRTNYGDESE